MPPSVDGESDRSEHVHPLINARLTSQTTGGQQAISEQDQRRTGPSGDFDGDLLRAQAASLLST
jgi:hypothetical protein